MKYIKNGIFYFIIFYIVVFSFLFIKQSFTIYSVMNQKVEFETKESYEQFIVDSRNKLEGYKNLASQEEYECLLEVEEAINISYSNQHPKASTYKELFEYYYSRGDDELFYNYNNIINKCAIDNSKDSLKDELGKASLANIALIEPELLKLLGTYELTFQFEDFIYGNNYEVSVDGILKNAEQTRRDLIINNEKKYINLLLDMVGDKYENLQ